MRRFVIFEQFEIYVVNFPFSDRDRTKRRPALIICSPEFIQQTGNILLAMVTSAKHSNWPGDSEIDDLSAAGLTHPCKIRMRFMTLAADQVKDKKGKLSPRDIVSVRQTLHATICT